MENRRILPPSILMKSEDNPGKEVHEDKKRELARDAKAESDATRKPDDPTEDGVEKKSLSVDDITVSQLLKGRSNAQELFDLVKSPVVGGSLYAGRMMPKNLTPSEGKVVAAQTAKAPGGLSSGPDAEMKKKAAAEKETMKHTAMARLKAQVATVKSEESYSLDFSKSILDKMGLSKAKKETNESGEKFQDGSEDTVGAEGHASPARPIAHEGGGEGPDHPGTKTKRASQEDGDLQKSDNLTDNLPEEFEEGIEDADTIPNEDEKAAVEGKKSFTYDEMNAAILLKSSPFAQQIVDLIKAARDEEAAKEYKYNAWRKRSDVRAAKWKSGIDATKRAVQHFKNKADLADEDAAGKSEGEGDLEKSHTSRIGNASPTKGAAGRHFAREAREDQKKEDAKYRVPRHGSVLGSGGEVTNVSDKVIRVRPAQGGTVGSEAKIKSIHTELDAILEKARRPSWDPKPKHVDEDKEAFHADSLSGDPGSREHEYKRKQELTDKWQAKKNSPEFKTASKIKDTDEATTNMNRQEIDELVAKSTPEWAAKKVGSAIGKFAKENVYRVPKDRKQLEQPPHKPKDPVLRNMANRVQKVGENMRRHYKMKPGEFEKYQGMADAEAKRTSKSFDEQTAEYFVKCHSHVLDGETEESVKKKKTEAPKADGHVFGADPKDIRADGEMVKVKEPEAYKSLDERTMDYMKAITGSKKLSTGDVDQHDEDLPHVGKYIRSTENSKVEGGKRVGPGSDRFTHTKFDPEKGEVKIDTSNWNEKKKTYEHGETTHPTHVKMGEKVEANQDLPRKSLITTVDELLEKSGIRQVHKVKNQGAASKVKKIDPKTISHDRQQQLLSGSAAKVKAYREEGYVPDKDDTPEVREQDRDPSNKSLTSTLDDLLKSLYDVVNHKRFSKMDPDAGINKKKEEAMERGPSDKGDYKPGSKTFNNPQDSQDPKIRYKSLDDRTCDLVKDLSQQRAKEIHDAAMTVRLSREGVSEAASKMDVSPSDVHSADSKLTGLHAAREQSLKSVCDTWIGETSMIKGHTILPGNTMGDLAKENRSAGSRTPTYQQTDEKQRDVDSGKLYRERKAKGRVEALKEEQAFGTK